MKQITFAFVALLSFGTIKAQSVQLCKATISRQETSLMINNGDSSHIYNAFVVSQLLGGISSVTLTCKQFSLNSQWVTTNDSTYTWSNVTVDSISNYNRGIAAKWNSNILQICLGRLYFSERHRFIIRIAGTNGILTKEFIF